MRFLGLLFAILFGMIEGITEWLPISSTGHLIILNEILPLGFTEEYHEFFLVAIQLGAILAVPFVFLKKYFSPCKSKGEKQERFRLLALTAVGVIPAAIVGFLFDDILDKFFYNYTVVAAMLILYGVVFICISNKKRGRVVKICSVEELTFKDALAIGLLQTLSLVPGTSRSGSTFLGGYIVGASRAVSAEFSFLMAMPIMLGATALKGGKLLLSGYVLTAQELILLLVSASVSFAVSFLSIKFLLDFVKKRSLFAFGIYRIFLGAAVILFFKFR